MARIERKTLILGIAGILGLTVLTLATRWYLFNLRHVSTDNAQIDGDLVYLSSKVAGRVAQVLVQDNAMVKAGEPLVKLETDDLDIAVAKADAAAKAAQGRLVEAKAALAVQQAQDPVDSASADARYGDAASHIRRAEEVLNRAGLEANATRKTLENAELERDAAARDFRRAQALAAQGAISAQALDAARDRVSRTAAEATAAIARDRAAQAAIPAAAADVASSRFQTDAAAAGKQQAANATLLVRMKQAAVKRAEAEAAVAEADLAAIRRQRKECLVVAPAAGRIGKRSVQSGQFVSVGSPLMALIPPRVWVVANLKETEVGQVHPGEAATVTVDALPGREFHGQVESIMPATGARFSLLPPDNATGNFTKVVQRVPVRIQLPEQADLPLLAPGLSAVVTITIKG